MNYFTDYAINELGEEYPEMLVNPCELCRMLFAPEHIGKFYDYVMSSATDILKEK